MLVLHVDGEGPFVGAWRLRGGEVAARRGGLGGGGGCGGGGGVVGLGAEVDGQEGGCLVLVVAVEDHGNGRVVVF